MAEGLKVGIYDYVMPEPATWVCVIAHAVGSFLSVNRTPYPEMPAREAIGLITAN